jgi:serine/threonine protein phosphatase PrpC
MNSEPVFWIGDKRPSNLQDENNDELSDLSQTVQLSIVGASVRGRMHVKSEKHNHRDDAFAGRISGNWLAVSVADGAGSRDLSRFGAAYSVNTFCDSIIDALGVENGDDINRQNGLSEKVLQAFKDTRAGLECFASQNGIKTEDLHCTLLGCVLNVVSGDMSVGQVGDGLILGLSKNGEAKPLVDPPSTGEVGVSFFLTQSNWEQYLSIKDVTKEEFANLITFYLMTDGVADDCQYGPPANILTLWAKDIDREIRSSSIISLEQAANDLKVYLKMYKAQGSFDDRTMVIVFKNGDITR